MSLNASISNDFVQRVLLIPEIQNKVFSFNKVGDAFRCSLVCKSWHPVALDHIWHHLPSIRPLFNFLAPVTAHKEDSNDPFDFERSITDNDRARFSTISGRVKYLDIRSYHWGHVLPSKSAIFEFSKLRLETTGSVLPNLKRLHCELPNQDALDLAALLLHSRLEWLFVTNDYRTRLGGTKAFLREVTLRSPNLWKLVVNISKEDAQDGAAELMQLILVQQSLVTLIVPWGTLTVSFLERLSCLPELRRASYTDGLINITEPSPLRTLPCIWRDVSVQFPSIRFLQLHAPLSTAGSFISKFLSFTNLVGLRIEMTSRNNAKDLRRFLEIVSDICFELEVLTLERNLSGEDRELAALDVVTKDTLAPLVSLRALRGFSLKHDWPIQMTDDELVDFLDSCPEFTELELNPHPHIPPSDVSLLPSLSVVHRLVLVQPRLEYLSMCFNGLTCKFVEMSAGGVIMPFEKLRSLYVGYTQINERSRIALYLRQVLPLNCEIGYVDKGDGGDSEEEESLWEDVIYQFNMLKYAFSSYKQQARRLNEENIRLKKAMKAAVLVLEAMCPGEEENRLGVASSGETETEHAA